MVISPSDYRIQWLNGFPCSRPSHNWYRPVLFFSFLFFFTYQRDREKGDPGRVTEGGRNPRVVVT
jgi:hypothetical protein